MTVRSIILATLGVLAPLAVAGCAASGTVPGPHGAAAPALLPERPSAGAAVITIDASKPGPAVAAGVYGASMATWFDFTPSFVNPSLASTGIHLVRFPGGSESDLYHWENGGSLCDPRQGYIFPKSTFDNLNRKVVQPLGLEVAITLNYGSNRTCDGGGDPNEAHAWVAHAKAIGAPVRLWTLGNESYGSWEYDLHARQHDPATYAGAFHDQFWYAVKSADRNAQLGVVVNTPGQGKWNDVVLRRAAPFDFVEFHYYPQYVHDNDAFLLGPAIRSFGDALAALRRQMTAGGVPASVPIYMGEFNADAGVEGKQSVSIVNGLFLGQMLGTLHSAGVPYATWWLAYGSCDVKGGDYSPSLYGWQHFGSEALFSDGLPDPTQGCGSTPKIPGGTPFPTARVMALYASSVPPGSRVLAVTLPGKLSPSVRAFAYARARGYVLVFFNNTLQTVSISARIAHAGRASYASARAIYGKAQYDLSRNNQWAGPIYTPGGKVAASNVALDLAPYSMTVVTLQ